MPTNTNTVLPTIQDIIPTNDILTTDTNSNFFSQEDFTTAIEDIATPAPTDISPNEVQGLLTTIENNAQDFQNLFPQNLESSGYIILSAIALVFIFYFLLQAMLFRKVLKNIKEGQQTLKDMTFSLYIQQQLTEYRLLLAELAHSTNAVEKTNARTQLYNHLNTIALKICETKDEHLAYQLAQLFFSKLTSRYLKLVSFPDGLIYFKYVSQFILDHPTLSTEDCLKYLRKNARKSISLIKETQKEVIPETLEKPKKKSKFQLFKKK